MTTDTFVTCAEFARRGNVSRAAIKKAIDDGRLSVSIVGGVGHDRRLHYRVACFEFFGNGHAATDKEKEEISNYEAIQKSDPAEPGKKARVPNLPKNKAGYIAAIPKQQAGKKSAGKKSGEKGDKKSGSQKIETEDLGGASCEDEQKITDLGTARTFAEARAVKEDYLARAAKLDYEKKAGLLIDTETVYRENARAGKLLRDAILSIPDRVAPSLTAAIGAKVSAAAVYAALEGELRNLLQEVAASGRIERAAITGP